MITCYDFLECGKGPLLTLMAFKGWIPDCVTLCLGSRSSWVCWVCCWFTGHPAIQWDPFLSFFVLLFIWQLSPQNKWFWETLTWPHAANEYSWGIHGHCGSPGPKLSYWGHGGHIWSHILNLWSWFFKNHNKIWRLRASPPVCQGQVAFYLLFDLRRGRIYMSGPYYPNEPGCIWEWAWGFLCEFDRWFHQDLSLCLEWLYNEDSGLNHAYAASLQCWWATWLQGISGNETTEEMLSSSSQ